MEMGQRKRYARLHVYNKGDLVYQMFPATEATTETGTVKYRAGWYPAKVVKVDGDVVHTVPLRSAAVTEW